MTKLYEKIRHGDRRTIVRKLKKGARITVPGEAILVMKANVAIKVTQQYDVNYDDWEDVTVHMDTMVEQNAPSSVVEDEKQAPLPKAQTLPTSWFQRVLSCFR